MDKTQANEVLGKVIDLMKAEGVVVESPYDISNFFEDHGSHTNMFETHRFDDMLEDDDED